MKLNSVAEKIISNLPEEEQERIRANQAPSPTKENPNFDFVMSGNAEKLHDVSVYKVYCTDEGEYVSDLLFTLPTLRQAEKVAESIVQSLPYYRELLEERRISYE